MRWRRGVVAGFVASLTGIAVAVLPATANAGPQLSDHAAAPPADCGYYFDGITPTWGNCTNHDEAVDIQVYAQGHQGDFNRCFKPGATDVTRSTFPAGFPLFAVKAGDVCTSAYPPAG